MRHGWTRTLAALAAAGLLLSACSDGGQEPAEDGADESGEELDEEALADMLEDQQQDMPDPTEDVEDGVYRGNGVALPVPDGWTIDPTALSQGLVAALAEDGAQQLTAQAVDVEEAAAAGQELDLDTLLDGVRQQVPQEAAVDEEVELAGASRAHQLTYLDLPGPEEGAPPSSTTIVLAEDGDGLIGEFAFSASADAYDDATVELLLADAGFDPDSEPQPLPQQPAPPAGGGEGQTDNG